MTYVRTGCESDNDIAYLDLLNKRLENNPSDVQALIEKGFLFVSRFYREQEGIELLERAARLAPTNLSAYFWLAMGLYQGLCNNERAELILREALKIDPNRTDCLTLLADLIEDANESVELLKRAVKLEPNLLFARLKLADQLLKKGKINEAEEEANEMLKAYHSLVFPKTSTAFDAYYEEFTGRYPEFKRDIDEFFLEIEQKRKEIYGAQKSKS